MAAKDFFHEQVKAALLREGWLITHDPYSIDYEDVKMAIDLGAEQMLAAEKGQTKIAVEIKSFLSESFIYEFHSALGQFLNYQWALGKVEPDRELFLAVPDDIFEERFHYRLVQEIIEQHRVNIIVFSSSTEEIVQWIS
ncbi:MAG: element excision factor XisH family protein [Bacteroidota bacterium]